MVYKTVLLSLFASIMVHNIHAEGVPAMITKRAPVPSGLPLTAGELYSAWPHNGGGSIPVGGPSWGANSAVAGVSSGVWAGSSSAYATTSGSNPYPASASTVPSTGAGSHGGQIHSGQNDGQNGGNNGSPNGGRNGVDATQHSGAPRPADPNAASSLLEDGKDVMIVLGAVMGVLALTL